MRRSFTWTQRLEPHSRLRFLAVLFACCVIRGCASRLFRSRAERGGPRCLSCGVLAYRAAIADPMPRAGPGQHEEDTGRGPSRRGEGCVRRLRRAKGVERARRTPLDTRAFGARSSTGLTSSAAASPARRLGTWPRRAQKIARSARSPPKLPTRSGRKASGLLCLGAVMCPPRP